jgi:hypothetical protein
MTTVIGRTEGHYEVHEMPYGRDYAWCPDCIVVECECGERLLLTRSKTACRCGADHTALVWEELTDPRPSDKMPHPWRDEYYHWREDRHLPQSEYYDWLELTTLE